MQLPSLNQKLRLSMRTYITVLIAISFAGIAHAQVQSTTSSNDQKVSVQEALFLYSKLVGKELVIDPSITAQSLTITISKPKPRPKAETIQEIESALRGQDNIIISPLDDKRLSVKIVKQ